MAEYWVNKLTGSDAGTGSELDPWFTVPGMTGGPTVASNDTINVRNGTEYNLRLVPPNNGLTYRGYGLADNVLYIRQPQRDVSKTTLMRVVREEGTHEGMWTVNGAGLGTSAIDVANARTGVTIEDVRVLGDVTGSSTAVTLGSSAAAAQTPVAMRRFEIVGAANAGLSCYKINPTLEYFKISGTVSDSWVLGATAANSYRAGSVDTVRYFECVEPNLSTVTGAVTGDSGDGFQLLHTSGRYESAVKISDFVIEKTNGIKQTAVIVDGLGGITVQRFHIISSPTAQAQILVANCRGNITIQNGYWKGGVYNNAAVRLRAAETALAQLLYTGVTLTLRDLVIDSPEGVQGLFDAADSDVTLECNGTLTIEHCTVKAPMVGALSYSGMVSLQGGNTTYGANFVLNLRNNVFDSDGIQLRLPSGTANNARFNVDNNAFRAGELIFIGATEYTTLSAFAAAHNAALANIDTDPALSPSYRPGANLRHVGMFIAYTKDAAGQAYNNPPSIGAYEHQPTRTAVSGRTAITR